MEQLTGSHIMRYIDNVPENKLFALVSVAKAIAVSILFLCVVALWDTLPSLPPMGDVTVAATTFSNTAVVTYTYKHQKAVDFETHYVLRNSKGVVMHDYGINRGHTTYDDQYERFQKVFVVPGPDHWCLETTVSWDYGLSLRSHNLSLPEVCFDVP